MKRRNLLAAFGALPWGALAHHGWSSFDQGRPIYLEGKVIAARWQNPHAELELEIPPGLTLPPDLWQRALPNQSAPVDGKALLAQAVLPTRKDRKWAVELAPLTRMSAWKIAPLKPGDHISLVGFTLKGEKGEAVVRVEYLFVGTQAYGLRSSPT